ncbi:MAG: isochorismatase family protein [Spirochaetaceae bacterium]|jgi:nicotinamidase/pyrazinamidase|nr:isochorismatase family protein [Spirochaetaceae bacterium]
MKKIDLLIIDAQNDFCEPEGALYVNGAENDCKRLAEFINRNSALFSNLYVTLDSHHNYDIAHPLYWIDTEGNHPDPFTIITEEDVKSGKWITNREEEREQGLRYVRTLSEKGKYSLCIWPPHCLIGSWGTQIQENVFKALNSWEIKNRTPVNTIYKGINPGTEHYGAFEAEVPQLDDKKTEMNLNIINELNQSDLILLAGQALDFCVANTVRQLASVLGDKNIQKMVLLKDCCSSVDPGSGLADQFIKELNIKGMKVINSSEFKELI